MKTKLIILLAAAYLTAGCGGDMALIRQAVNETKKIGVVISPVEKVWTWDKDGPARHGREAGFQAAVENDKAPAPKELAVLNKIIADHFKNRFGDKVVIIDGAKVEKFKGGGPIYKTLPYDLVIAVNQDVWYEYISKGSTVGQGPYQYTMGGVITCDFYKKKADGNMEYLKASLAGPRELATASIDQKAQVPNLVKIPEAIKAIPANELAELLSKSLTQGVDELKADLDKKE